MNVSKKIMLSLFACCAFAGSISAAEENHNQVLFEAALRGDVAGIHRALQNGADGTTACDRVKSRLQSIEYFGTEPGSELDITKNHLRVAYRILASGEGPSSR